MKTIRMSSGMCAPQSVVDTAGAKQTYSYHVLSMLRNKYTLREIMPCAARNIRLAYPSPSFPRSIMPHLLHFRLERRREVVLNNLFTPQTIMELNSELSIL